MTEGQARQIVDSFNTYVAQPLEANLKKLTGRDLAKRNPFVYASLGAEDVDEWAERVLADKQTSAMENAIGTWLEDVARIASGGFKPGGGVDLQRELPDGDIELYALQTAGSTKNSGGRRSDVQALQRGAAVLRAHRRHVTCCIGVLFGRRKSSPLRADPSIIVLASDEFWDRITGIKDFGARLLRVANKLAPLVAARASDDAERIQREACSLFGDEGKLDLEKVLAPPSR